MTATYADGTPVPKGAAVLDANGVFVTLVGSGGQIFLPDMLAGATPFSVSPSEEASCTLEFDIADTPDLNALYERASATCTP
ncbi:hypothetical protein D3C71_2099010 [compost metagenome]